MFGKAKADSAQAVTSVWENAKRKERGEQTVLERVEDVAASLPALMRAQKIIRREAAGGKIDAAGAEQALLERARGAAQALDERRLGEMLESLCALADAHGLDAETALRAAAARRIEQIRAQSGGKVNKT